MLKLFSIGEAGNWRLAYCRWEGILVSRCLIICIMYLFSPLLKIESTHGDGILEEGIHVYCDRMVLQQDIIS
jgi:hypothetical protein